MSKVLGKKTMATVGVMHSFLNEQELNRDEENFQNHICIRFIRKKFKCLIIFFLSICILGETLIMAMDKINFSTFNSILQKFLASNQSMPHFD